MDKLIKRDDSALKCETEADGFDSVDNQTPEKWLKNEQSRKNVDLCLIFFLNL